MDDFIRKVEDFKGTFEELMTDAVKCFFEVYKDCMTSDFILYGIF